MRITALIMVILLLMGCKTKRAVKTLDISSEISKTQIKKDSSKNVSKVQEKNIAKENSHVEKKKENQTDIEVTGKAQTGVPIEIYNIENGDTLQAIKVTGNAEVQVRSKTSKSDHLKKENSSESIIDKLKEFSETIVNENNVKERVQNVKKKSKEAVTRTGTLWSFGLIGGLGAFAMLLIALFIYFKNYRKK
ncbi:hypothetical protein CHRYSEOSP005_00280 [Chryseobacterium sp. Alg-005]|uniref:hypothetical protein n=1 Tax=Chryseobacterium sp. Alg-005 TaxID=3159516 RepID=UPI0035558786